MPPRPVRRLLLPVTVVAIVVLMAGLALAAAVGLVVAPLARHRRLLRVACFGLAYLATELMTMAAALGLLAAHVVRGGPERSAVWAGRNRRLLAWALGVVLGAARRCFGFSVVTEDRPVPVLEDRRPALVLARHGGPGDSFALVHLLLTTYGLDVRIVLKEVLQLDPILDILLNRLGSCFLPPAGDDLAVRLGRLAAGLGAGQALLVFPEGGNWTPERRVRAIRRLGRDGHRRAARAATLMANVLPARPGGVLACLDARPDLGVVMVAHAGLDRIVSVRQAWDELPVSRPMTVRLWPASPPPEGEDERLAWLATEWATVDEWVDAFHQRTPG